ncbi:MAG: DNA polymerase III subunit beta [Planctomycetota bacterium]
MKITCDRRVFAAAYQTVAAFAPTRSPKEILTNVLVTASDSSIKLSATDMEVGFCTEIKEGIEVSEGGSVLLPVVRTAGIVRESNDEQLKIENQDGTAIIKGDRSNFRLPTANPEEFPGVRPFESRAYHIIESEALRTAIGRTVRFTENDSARYALGAVLVQMEGEDINVVGTDGRRLGHMAITGESVQSHQTSGFSTLIPTKSAVLIQRVLSHEEGPVYFAAHPSDVQIKMGNGVLYTRLVEGRFPNWRQVIPNKDNSEECQVTAGVLASAVRQAAITTDQESRALDIQFADRSICLEATAADVGSSRVEVPVEYDGSKIEVNLDHRYVADFCKSVDPEDVLKIELHPSHSPVVFRTDDRYECVIMPMSRDS